MNMSVSFANEYVYGEDSLRVDEFESDDVKSPDLNGEE